jgi:hypothetical protein
LKDYDKCTNTFEGNYLFDPDVKNTHRIIKDVRWINFDELSPQSVNTKEYWNFIHENFPFCDVCSYYRATDLQSYFAIKGPHYDSVIKELGLECFKNKKILEIGPGYGYLPKTLTENHIPHTYYCADIVHRFDHDNFIDVSGYTLSPITGKFDLIIMQDVIQHLGSDIFKTYTREIKGMLNDGGKLIIETALNSYDDLNGHFFGQTYYNLGYSNIQKHMNELGFVQDFKYLILNDKKIAIILKYTL